MTLRYELPRDEPVTLAIYDAGGRLVRTLESGVETAGGHALTWDLRDETGRSAQAGLYFVRLDAGALHFTRRLATLR